MENKTDFAAQVAARESAEQHAEEIRQTRVGGLGGSDAAILLRIGQAGLSALTATDNNRLCVMLGLIPVSGFGGNVYTAAGHKYEDWVDEMKPWGEKHYDREAVLEMPFAKKFKTFAHADFFNAETGVVVECKFVQADTDKVAQTYHAQLQWYYMLGAKEVYLMHGQGSVEPFEVAENALRHVERDQTAIDTMLNGIKILDDALEGGWQPAQLEKVTIEETPEIVRKAFDEMDAVKVQEAELKARKDAATAVLKAYCEDWGLSGIVRAGENKRQAIYTKAGVTRTLDVEKLRKEHPEIDYEQYYKETKRAASITFK